MIVKEDGKNVIYGVLSYGCEVRDEETEECIDVTGTMQDVSTYTKVSAYMDKFIIPTMEKENGHGKNSMAAFVIGAVLAFCFVR